MKTGFAAVKLAIAGFIVPFMFVYSPQLLLINTSFLEGLRVTIGACLGVFMIGVAVEGYLFVRTNGVIRLIAACGALALIDSGIYSDMVGFGALVVLVSYQYFSSRNNKNAVPV